MAVGLASSILANRSGRVPLPRAAYLLLTWKCNLRCVMCNVWKEDRYPHLDTTEFLGLIRRLPPLDVVKISGGEPFLRDDVPRLVAEIQRVVRPHYLQVVSNGTLRDRMVEFVRKCGRPGLHLRISVEGRGETHDRLRGRKGCFEKTLATLEALLPYKRKLGFSLGLNYHLTPETAEDLPWVQELCRREGLALIPGFWVFPFLEPGDPAASRALCRDPAAFRRLLGEVYRQDRRVGALEAHLVRRATFRVFDEALDPNRSKRFACRALRSILYLLPDGNVITCGIKHGPIGNLAREEFRQIWYGPRAEEGRRVVDACPGCHQYAMKILSRTYTGEAFGLGPPREWLEKGAR